MPGFAWHCGRVFVLRASSTGLHLRYNMLSLRTRRASLAHFAFAHISGASATLIKYTPQLWKTPGACNLFSWLHNALGVSDPARANFFGCDCHRCCNFTIHLPVLVFMLTIYNVLVCIMFLSTYPLSATQIYLNMNCKE